MGVGAGLYMYVVVVQKFTFAISSPDEFLFSLSLQMTNDFSYNLLFPRKQHGQHSWGWTCLISGKQDKFLWYIWTKTNSSSGAAIQQGSAPTSRTINLLKLLILSQRCSWRYSANHKYTRARKWY